MSTPRIIAGRIETNLTRLDTTLEREHFIHFLSIKLTDITLLDGMPTYKQIAEAVLQASEDALK